MSIPQPIHLTPFSSDLRHLLLDTIPTLLRCNDSFFHPLHRMHPTQKFERRHQHDLTSEQARTRSCVSPLARYSRATVGSEDAAALGASCSNRTVLLNLSGCSSPAAPGPLLPSWMSLILSSSCWVFSDVTARCVRLSTRHLLIILAHPCTSLNSSSLPLFHSLCLDDSVFLRIHPCFSRQGSLNDRSDSFSALIVMWLCRFSMRCKRCASSGQPPKCP